MRSNRIARILAAGTLAIGLEAGDAGADLVQYSWSGRVEPLGANPWGLAGDGSAVTNDDGTPFTLEGFVDRDAIDEDGTLSPDRAAFLPEAVTLEIGGHVATVTSPVFLFADDEFDGLFDAIDLQAEAELFGTTLSFQAEVRLPASTFDLAAPAAPDPPPIFADTLPIQFGGATTAELITIPEEATVKGLLEVCGSSGSPAPVEWTTPSAGIAGLVGVSVANLESPSLDRVPLNGPDFAAAPLCSTAQSIAYTTGSDWTVTLSEPAAALLVYAESWRGSGGGVDPVTYQFDAPFTILSGLAQASVSNGDTLLSAPGPGALDLHDGILRFEGPIASLSVETNSTESAEQRMTFAVVPEPDAASGALASLAALWVLRRLFARACARDPADREHGTVGIRDGLD